MIAGSFQAGHILALMNFFNAIVSQRTAYRYNAGKVHNNGLQQRLPDAGRLPIAEHASMLKIIGSKQGRRSHPTLPGLLPAYTESPAAGGRF